MEVCYWRLVVPSLRILSSGAALTLCEDKKSLTCFISSVRSLAASSLSSDRKQPYLQIREHQSIPDHHLLLHHILMLHSCTHCTGFLAWGHIFWGLFVKKCWSHSFPLGNHHDKERQRPCANNMEELIWILLNRSSVVRFNSASLTLVSRGLIINSCPTTLNPVRHTALSEPRSHTLLWRLNANVELGAAAILSFWSEAELRLTAGWHRIQHAATSGGRGALQDMVTELYIFCL